MYFLGNLCLELIQLRKMPTNIGKYAFLFVTPFEELYIKTAILSSSGNEFVVIYRYSKLFAEFLGNKQSATSKLASDGDDDLFHDFIIIEHRVLLMNRRLSSG